MSKQMPFPEQLKRLLGADRLPAMDASWMEKLLQSFLYEDTAEYNCPKEYREQLIAELKAEGLIEKKKVCLTKNETTEKLLLRSKGKSEFFVVWSVARTGLPARAGGGECSFSDCRGDESFCRGIYAGVDWNQVTSWRGLGSAVCQFLDSGKFCRVLYAE